MVDYDPRTGFLTWRIAKTNWLKPGDRVGNRNKGGHWETCINRERYYLHHLAWLWMTGAWPEDQIDHKDGDPSNNAWHNLRPSNQSQNMANGRKSKRNTSGYKGVTFDKRFLTWDARIGVRGKYIFLGAFPSAKEAHAAYVEGAKRFHGEFARAE